jgi:hypothetical protein
VFDSTATHIAIFDFMKCVSFNKFEVANVRVESLREMKGSEIYIQLKGQEEEHMIHIGVGGSVCIDLITKIAQVWKKHGNGKRQFYYLPQEGIGSIPMVGFFTPNEAYALQEKLDYLIAPF